MMQARHQVAFLSIGVLLAGCMAGKELPPALPDESRIIVDERAYSSYVIPPEATVPTTGNVQAPPAPAQTAPPEAHGTPTAVPPSPLPIPPRVPTLPDGLQITQFRTAGDLSPKRKGNTQIVEEVNAQSRMSPNQGGYAKGNTAIFQYPYIEGKTYDIYTAPTHPTTILLPRGERLASSPAMNPEQWDLGTAEIGDGEYRQEAIIIRPVASNLAATTPLLLQSGRILFCHLTSYKDTAMTAVTWNMPRMAIKDNEGKTAQVPAPIKAPKIDISRLHTAYKIETTSGAPAWVPQSVYDDGVKTIVKFEESLQHTVAPGVFVIHTDGRPGVAEFTPYEVPGDPQAGAYYIINGLWPRLELRGADKTVVVLTRLQTKEHAYREVKHGN